MAVDRQKQRDIGRSLVPTLRGAHEARHSNDWMRALAELGPVPAINVDLPTVEEQLGALVLAYALLVDQLLDDMDI